MRLTHIKIAGFKSFVEPTILHMGGQRVSIVGPNGCGKSNVIEAVRWVLGESSARELRGDSMQDVIFNGTLNRKPVSRASVELYFDNSLGGASGQWSSYTEISIKRVLERDGNSSYLINNMQVRRRDVTDLFLGTGVGSRTYAIIGQNTISRMVEAKPDELRIYLEEAAGVSKYKERRRETELRLKDSRENLLRIDDIRGELEKQIVQLESQAEVATQYHQLQQQLENTHQLLWMLKKRQAASEWKKTQKRVASLVNELESGMTALRKTESDIEQLRLQQSEAGSTLQKNQAAFYEASAALSGIEQSLKHAQENIGRAEARERELHTQQQRLQTQHSERHALLVTQEHLLQEAEAKGRVADHDLQKQQSLMPDLESKQLSAQHVLNASHEKVMAVEQAFHIALSDMQHQHRQLEQLQQRQQRLAAEQAGIVLPDNKILSEKEQQQAQRQQQITAMESDITGLQQLEAEQQNKLIQLQQRLNEATRRITQLEAQLATLSKIQQSVDGDIKLADWLAQYQWSDRPRFWQLVQVDSGWETALESILGERLNALVLDTLEPLENLNIPPVSVALCAASSLDKTNKRSDLLPLQTRVKSTHTALSSVINDWLADIYMAESIEQALTLRSQLTDGQRLVCPEGHIVSRSSVRLYAPDSLLHGVLERQRELESLESQLPEAKQALLEQEQLLKSEQDALLEIQRKQIEQRQRLKDFEQQYQTLLLETQKLRQQLLHAEERMQKIVKESEETANQITDVQNLIRLGEQTQVEQEANIEDLKRQRGEHQTALSDAENALSQAREILRQHQQKTQDQSFEVKILSNKIIELKDSIKAIDEQKNELSKQLQDTQTQRDNLDIANMKQSLAQAVELRQQCESAVTTARNQLSEIEAKLDEADRRRLQSEHNLHPLRDRLEQSRLAEQETRLHFEHCAEQLLEVDEASLSTQLDKNQHPDKMERKIEQIQTKIQELGAVNLAAIEQLASEKERAGFLDSQAQDLNLAIKTLEEAIHRIDKETRDRLQNTYDEVNRNFGALFATLFDGGQARLELLGEEILDTGLQVVAQPPGKKNSTIHLLSGGEKALTALALVFAIFQLNPAPFCLMDEVDAPLDDSNTERFCTMVKKMSEKIQFIFISHNKIAIEMAQQLIGVTMQESGVSRVVEVDVEQAMHMTETV